VAGNFRSKKFLLRALAVVPQAALFARQMEQLGIEHVHAHYATHPALAAYVVRQLAGIPYSFTAHAHDIYVNRTMLGEKIRAASFVVTISEYNRTLLADLYAESREKTVVIHCGVDPDVFRPAERTSPPRRRTGPFTLVCVASLQEYKGHPYLVEACALLRDRGIPFHCFLIGEGDDRQAIEAQISNLGLERQVQLLGRQPRNRVSRFVREADAMVLPSVVTSTNKQEGIPVALMEALAAERPVVASAISGIPELIEDGVTGLLAPERDAAALADAVERLYADPDLGARLGAAGREKVLRDFHLSRNAGRLHGLLNQDWSDDSASTTRSHWLGKEFGSG
jgi:glycosyltransferase involved in cell wall biosynthesis